MDAAEDLLNAAREVLAGDANIIGPAEYHPEHDGDDEHYFDCSDDEEVYEFFVRQIALEPRSEEILKALYQNSNIFNRFTQF